ncbi:MAG: hypothetical protein Q4A15_13395 [Prevotellaceae bacterium]|nr:hypothetical protein [Prevotellaceae bacterium]
MGKVIKADAISESMRDTIMNGDLSFIGDLGEVALDTIIDNNVLKEIPIIGTIVGVGKCIETVSNLILANKLRSFIFPIRDTNQEERISAIMKWEEDSKYRMHVGETLLGMINRCDNSLKAGWLSKLFYQMILKWQKSSLFMRSEKILSSLSVMDIQSFLDLPPRNFSYILEEECEPFYGSGLYGNPQIEVSGGGVVDMGKRKCHITECGYWIYSILNDMNLTVPYSQALF